MPGGVSGRRGDSRPVWPCKSVEVGYSWPVGAVQVVLQVVVEVGAGARWRVGVQLQVVDVLVFLRAGTRSPRKGNVRSEWDVNSGGLEM